MWKMKIEAQKEIKSLKVSLIWELVVAQLSARLLKIQEV